MLDYGFVFVAAKDCFDGYVFAGIDAFDDLRRNLVRRPVVGRIPCDTRIARVEGLSSVVRIQQTYLATWEELEGFWKSGEPVKVVLPAPFGPAMRRNQAKRKVLSQSVSRILVF